MSATLVTDDFTRLRTCAVFAPGREFERLLPEHIEAAVSDGKGGLKPNPDYLLFDDLVHPAALSVEHADLRNVLTAAIGADNLVDLRDLLQRILWEDELRKRVVDAILQLEIELFGGHGAHVRDALIALPPAQLAEALVIGCAANSSVPLLRWPMPNWLFARDCFAVAAGSVILGHPSRRARRRDGLLARAIVRYHPMFSGADVIDVETATGESGPRCFEGGDLVLPADGVALIGIGLRTNDAGAKAVAHALQVRGFHTVLGVRLPKRRGAMHLDTIFTLLDQSTCLQFDEAFDDSSAAEDRVTVFDLLTDKVHGHSLVSALRSEGVDLEPVACGGGDRVAAKREQWTDGANAMCLGPGRAMLYARNVRTLAALNDRGFEVLQPAEFVRNAGLLMRGDRRFIVALSGFELSRGRGGPRCLTLPIARG